MLLLKHKETIQKKGPFLEPYTQTQKQPLNTEKYGKFAAFIRTNTV